MNMCYVTIKDIITCNGFRF